MGEWGGSPLQIPTCRGPFVPAFDHILCLVTLILHPGLMSPWVLLVVGILLLLPAGFSIFGFLASAELPSEEAHPWRIGYGTLFFLCLGSSVGLIGKAVRNLLKR